MGKAEHPVTQTVRFLCSKKINSVPYVHAYEEHGGMTHFAECVGKPKHQIIKTIILQDEHKKGLVTLTYDDKHISTRNLACELGLKHVEPIMADQAAKWTGYLVGGIPPFGMKTALPVYVEESTWVLDEIFINGGKRGSAVGTKSENLRMLNPQDVHVAVDV